MGIYQVQHNHMIKTNLLTTNIFLYKNSNEPLQYLVLCETPTFLSNMARYYFNMYQNLNEELI